MVSKIRVKMISYLNDLLDRWGAWVGTTLAGLLGIIFSVTDHFDLTQQAKFYMFLGGLALTGVSAFLAWVYERNRPKIYELEEQLQGQQEIIDEIAENIYFLLDGLILDLARKIRIFDDTSSRVSLYVHSEDDAHFIPCGRFSANPELKKPGRQSYPENEGCIAQGWQHRWFFVNDLPKTRGNHQRRCQRDFGIPKTTHDNFKMVPVLIAVKQLSWNGENPNAVIVVESKRGDAFSEEKLKEDLNSIEEAYAQTIGVFIDQILESKTTKGVE